MPLPRPIGQSSRIRPDEDVPDQPEADEPAGAASHDQRASPHADGAAGSPRGSAHAAAGAAGVAAAPAADAGSAAATEQQQPH